MKVLSAILPLSFVMIFLVISGECFSQGFNDKFKYSTLEVGLSNAYFTGKDLPLKANRSFSPGLTFSITTTQSPRIRNGIMFSMNYPTSKSIGRKDSLSDYTYVYYQTRIHKYEFFLTIDILEHRGRLQKRPDFSPYIHMGIGWIKMKQKMRYGYEDMVAVKNITHQSYDKRSFVLPIGIGLRYKLSKMTNVSLELIYNVLFTNQLDLDYMNGFRYSNRNDSYLNVNLRFGFI